LIIGNRNKPNEILVKDPSLLSIYALNYAYCLGGHIEGWSEGVKNMFLNFYKYIIENGNPKDYRFSTFDDGYKKMKIIDAILESAKKEGGV